MTEEKLVELLREFRKANQNPLNDPEQFAKVIQYGQQFYNICEELGFDPETIISKSEEV